MTLKAENKPDETPWRVKLLKEPKSLKDWPSARR